MFKMCEYRSPGVFKNIYFALKGVQISLVAGVSKKYQTSIKHGSKNDTKIDKIGSGSALGNDGKNVAEKCPKVEKMGCQRDPKSV